MWPSPEGMAACGEKPVFHVCRWQWDDDDESCVCVCAPSPRTLMFKSRARWGVTVPLRRSHDREGELDGGSRKSVCQEDGEEEEEEPEHINNTQRKETNVQQKVSLFYRHGRHQRYVKYRCRESPDGFAREVRQTFLFCVCASQTLLALFSTCLRSFAESFRKLSSHTTLSNDEKMCRKLLRSVVKLLTRLKF